MNDGTPERIRGPSQRIFYNLLRWIRWARQRPRSGSQTEGSAAEWTWSTSWEKNREQIFFLCHNKACEPKKLLSNVSQKTYFLKKNSSAKSGTNPVWMSEGETFKSWTHLNYNYTVKLFPYYPWVSSVTGWNPFCQYHPAAVDSAQPHTQPTIHQHRRARPVLFIASRLWSLQQQDVRIPDHSAQLRYISLKIKHTVGKDSNRHWKCRMSGLAVVSQWMHHEKQRGWEMLWASSITAYDWRQR